MKVGISILNFNCSEFLDITLDSLTRAKCETEFVVGVLDNGSEVPDAKRCKAICEQYFSHKLTGFLISERKNLGFSGGNNVLIRRFLEDDSITHICLLNSDIIVTTGWLDRLQVMGAQAVGPVTNATGNEQTVSVDYSVGPDRNAFETVDAYAQKRYEIYGGYQAESDVLYFFNTVFARSVFEKIGLLDERFYPGSFEDNDFCMRMQQAGIRMKIARGCFVHHFGSGSFSKLDMPKRVNISNKNQRKFEEKWNTHWTDASWKLVESCRQDMIYFAEKHGDKWPFDIISSELQDVEKMVFNWAEAIAWYQSEQYAQQILEANGVNKAVEEGETEEQRTVLPFTMPPLDSLSGKQLLRLAWKKAILKIKRLLGLDKLHNRKVVPAMVQEESNVPDEWDEFLNQARQRESICVFAPMFHKNNERDGYIQRIRAIDMVILKGLRRFYLMGDDQSCERPCINKIDGDHFYIRFNSFDETQRAKIFQLVSQCRRTYTHSLLRFMADTVAREMCGIFSLPGVRHIWDVHGSVPEEYELNGGELGCRMANELETFLYARVNTIVCVNHAMECHLRAKHGQTQAEFVILPIFNERITQRVDCQEDKALGTGGRPRIVYAGGLQKWQNIEQMQDVIERTMFCCDYRILVPVPRDFKAMWGKRVAMKHVTVESKDHEEIGEVYRGCHYGLVLRDDIVVNQVACPTKIIEYIQYGIIPVLKSEHVGDFVELGMRYVPVEDLINGQLPDEETRKEMARENYSVLDRLLAQYQAGTSALIQFVNSGRVGDVA